jgi:uncharacterized protein (DUF302 family)
VSYGTSVTVSRAFDTVVADVRTALAEQGFGVLTEIDLTETLKAKLGVDVERYVILGACNPPLAHRAVQAERSIGLLLPCNVVVREVDDGVLVELLDPQVMVAMTGNPDIRAVADEVAGRLEAVRRALAG